MTTAIAAAVQLANGPTALARIIGITPGAVSQLLSGARPVPPDRCPAIERATGAKVTCEELRPDVRWQRVPDTDWPHPGGRPCIDVAAPAVEQKAA